MCGEVLGVCNEVLDAPKILELSKAEERKPGVKFIAFHFCPLSMVTVVCNR